MTTTTKRAADLEAGDRFHLGSFGTVRVVRVVPSEEVPGAVTIGFRWTNPATGSDLGGRVTRRAGATFATAR